MASEFDVILTDFHHCLFKLRLAVCDCVITLYINVIVLSHFHKNCIMKIQF